MIFIPTVSKTLKEVKDFNSNITDKAELDNAIEYVKTLDEDAVLFGRGWWQNPVIAIETNRVIHNLDCEPIYGNSYFVEDVYMKTSETVDEVNMDHYLEETFSNSQCSVFKLYDDRDQRLSEIGPYIRIDAFMPYWGSIDINYDNGSEETIKYTCMKDHISLKAPENVKRITLRFNNYKGEVSEIKDVTYVKGEEKTELLGNDNYSVTIINDPG